MAVSRFLPATRWLVLTGALAVLAACGPTETRLAGPAAEEPKYKVGHPYQVAGRWFYPAEVFDYDHTGIASWYGTEFHGRRTANGEVFDMDAVSAAHPTLPMPSLVQVTNLENGRRLTVRINDRGPFARGRIIDLSRRAARLLGFEQRGTARVRVKLLADESRTLKLRSQMRSGAAGQVESAEAVPRIKVVVEDLPPSTQTAALDQGVDAATVAPAPRSGAGRRTAVWDAPEAPAGPPGELVVVPTRPTQLYVQAGAFNDSGNARRVLARLHRFPGARVSPVIIDGVRYYRVRIGPIASVAKGDQLLARLVRAGYPGAHLVVE